MIVLLADTSAWIEFFEDSGSGACESLSTALRDRQVAVVDPVIMEVMAGVRPHEVDAMLRLLTSQSFEPIATRLDWLDAATIYRNCRREGVTIRSQTDCLIAAAAIRLRLPVLEHDRDFPEIAKRTRLQLA